MKTMTKFLAGAAGLAATMAVAAPASAQYYPSPYGNQYGYGNSGVIGQILNSIINPYGRTGYYNYGGEQRQVEVCVQAVQQRLNSMGYNPYNGGGYNPYGGYNQPYGGYNQPYGGGYGNYGYNQPYGGANARIASVDRVERRSDGVRVKGTAFMNGYAQPYGGYGNNYYNGRGDVNFNCRIRNDMRITDIDLEDRRTGRRIG